jgi:hypothetical protein
MSLSSLFARLFQSKTTADVEKIENLIQSFFGSDSNFGKETKNNFRVKWDSVRGKNILDNGNNMPPDYRKELSESLFMRCASNFCLINHFIENIEKDSLSKNLIFNIKGTISSSFYENIATRMPLLSIYNLDYLLGCHFATFFITIKPYLEISKFDKLASTILDISFTQIKANHLYFQFLKHIDKYKQTSHNKNHLISSLDIFYGVTDAEYALVLIKSLPEKMLIAVSIILDCEKQVKSAKRTNAMLNAIDQQIILLQNNTSHWSPLKKYFHSDNLKDLNRIRTGILHENGIGDLDFTRCNHEEQMKGALAINGMLKKYSFIMHMCFIVTLMLVVDETIIKGTIRQATTS